MGTGAGGQVASSPLGMWPLVGPYNGALSALRSDLVAGLAVKARTDGTSGARKAACPGWLSLNDFARLEIRLPALREWIMEENKAY